MRSIEGSRISSIRLTTCPERVKCDRLSAKSDLPEIARLGRKDALAYILRWHLFGLMIADLKMAARAARLTPSGVSRLTNP
ncbi:hypothetical protein AB9K35_21835 [Leisingera sp. XS_AS12]|uniref:hypothetical protein n=1 Tax=Leisingera sp. XS_AS12 TaxID=3241294 RepID=UPI0035132FFF